MLNGFVCAGLWRFLEVGFWVKISFDHMFDHIREKKFICRGVAQLGRALRSGRRGRAFKSRRLDQKADRL